MRVDLAALNHHTLREAEERMRADAESKVMRGPRMYSARRRSQLDPQMMRELFNKCHKI